MPKLDTIAIERLWVKRGCSLNTCSFCEEKIYSDEYHLHAQINGKVLVLYTEIILCESCYEIIKEF